MDDSMDVDDEQPIVRLKSCDGKRFAMTRSQASCSNTLRGMMESLQGKSNGPTEYIVLPTVPADLLQKVIHWTEWHAVKAAGTNSQEDDQTIGYATCPREPDNYQMTDQDKAFLANLDELQLFKLTHVANYLDVRSLFSSCCQTIAKIWEGKKVEQIRNMYNIENDFNPEEENLILEEVKKFGIID